MHRVAVIGCGDIARTGHVPALVAHPDFDLVALCDTHRDRVETLAREYGCPEITVDYRTLLPRDDIDAVIVTTHPEHSVGIAIDAMQAGKHVLDEKPIAVTMDDALRLREAVHHAQTIYQIGFVLRSCDWVQGFAALARPLGEPSLTEMAVYDERLDRDNHDHFEKIQRALAVSSAVTHEGSHVMDYTRLWISGQVETVSAAALRTDPTFAGPNLAKAQLRMDEGSVLDVTIGWHLPDLPPSFGRVVGPRGWLTVGLYDGLGQRVLDGRHEPVRLPGLKQNWQAQLDAFNESIRAGRTVGPTADDGVYALNLTLACERSARNNGQTMDVMGR